MFQIEDLRHIILNVNQPTVIRNPDNIKDWPIFSMTFEQWAAEFDAAQTTDTSFDVGYKKFPNLPQFECFRSKCSTKMQNLLTQKYDDDNVWRCHNYKYLKDCPEVCRGGVNYSDLGFPDVDDDISFWVGQPGSHTPCHYDTYGCNVVVQIFGRKSWLLFPPSTSGMAGTRIPYEESSVYSALNFYSPDPDGVASAFRAVESQGHQVVLEPGSILIVPPRWWHFVECADTSLNFNTWIKLESDLEAQIGECKTRIHMKNYLADEDMATSSLLLNPNEADLLSEPLQQLQDTLEYLANLKTTGKRVSNHRNRHSLLSGPELNELLRKYEKNVQLIKPLPVSQFYELLKANSARYTTAVSDVRTIEFENLLKDHNCLNLALIKAPLAK